MAFSNDEKQEIKDIVLETMTEQSDAVDYTEQVVEFAPGDEVPIVRNGDGTGEKSYARAPVSMFGGGGSSGVNGIKVGGSGQVLTPTSGVVTLPAYESGAEKNPVKYLKEAAISQDGNSLTIKDNNNETKTFTPIGGGGGSVTPSDADPLEDGTKSAGSSASYSRGDHRHPHDTTKADKSEMAITPGTGENSDKTTIQLKNGLSTTVLTQHQDITGKVDKVNGKGLSSNDYTTDEKNKLNGIETGAEKHKAPTSQEVKNALGTGSGTTKYLREDGEWATPPSGGGGGNTADVNYDTTNKKITKTIDGVTSDVVTVATLKTDMNLGNVGNFKAVSTDTGQGLTDTEKGNARTNIGAQEALVFNSPYNASTNKVATMADISNLFVTHLNPGDISDTIDNYYEDNRIGQWTIQQYKGSSYLYETGNQSTLYYSATGSHTPIGVRLLYYDKNLFFIGKSDLSTASSYTVPSETVYVSFVLYYQALDIQYINDNLQNISFSFLSNGRIYIDKDLKFPNGVDKSYNINLEDVSNTYIEYETSSSKFLQYQQFNDGTGKSICIPYSTFKDFDYIEIVPNASVNSVFHCLKKEPTVHGETVQYSDYYGYYLYISPLKSSKFYKIPSDARYIMIYASYGGTSHLPQRITLHTRESLNLDDMPMNNSVFSSNRNPNQYSFKLIHWNIGNFSKGSTETAINDSNYTEKLASFKAFINGRRDYNFVLNEYNKVFARLSGGDVYTYNVLFEYAYDFGSYVRCNNWDELAHFSTNTLTGHTVGVPSSVIGMTSGNNHYFPKPYVIYRHYLAGSSLYIMHTHLSEGHSTQQLTAIFTEMISIMSGYTNVVIAGDLNTKVRSNLDVFVNAGYTIANDSTPTYPGSSSIYDWIVYRGNFTSVDFEVCTDAVDSGYSIGDSSHMLSDHWPIAITINYQNTNIVPSVRGAYRYNPTTNLPEWNNGITWFSFQSASPGNIFTDVFTGTTSGYGNVKIQKDFQFVMLSAWAHRADTIVNFYPQYDLSDDSYYLKGYYAWYFHVTNDSNANVANVELKIYYSYVVIS